VASEELNELMLLYVVDGLEPDTRDWLQRLLDAGDVDAERALAEAAETVSSLPEALDREPPSPEVLADLVRCAKASERARPEGDGEQAGAAGPMPIRGAEPDAGATLGRDADPRAGSKRVGAWPRLVIAAAFVLGVGLAGVVMLEVLDGGGSTGPIAGAEEWADVEALIAEQERALNQQQTELARMRSQLATLEEQDQIESLRQTIEDQRLAIQQQENTIDRLQESVSLLVGPGVQQAELAGGDAVPNAQGRLMWDPNTGQMRLLTRGLEPLKPGQTYQLWFVTKSGDPVSLGVFEVDQAAANTAAYVTTAPIVPSNVNVAAISIEPQGGSPEPGPTGPIIMTGPPKGE